MSLNKLFLDRSRIEEAIRNFDGRASLAGPCERGKAIEYMVTIDGEQPATLHFYFRTDSTTTISAGVGRNQILSQSIAEHVAKTCQKKEFQQQPLVLSSISDEDWKWLLNHLADDYKYSVTEATLQYGVRFDVKKNAHDQINLNRYNTGRFMMQGKAREVYSTVATALCELVPDKRKIVEAQLVCYEVDEINADDLIAEVLEHLPTGAKVLGDTGVAILAPALALIKLEIKLPDYTAIAFPALKALEGYMKVLMAKHDQPVLNHAGFGNYFLGDRLKSGVQGKIGCARTISAIEQSYALYNRHRPSLFHVDANVEMSRILENRTEAITIVHDVLRTIEGTSALIPQ